MKRILGLDLGTNSIGWALVEIDHKNGIVKILGLGSRILPMDAGEVKDFESSGKIKSTTAQRTEKRGARRLNERFLLRRDRLHLILNLLSALPEHYKIEIDFTNKKGEKSGKFKNNTEPKLAYLPKQEGQKKAEFLFKESYQEMLDDMRIENKKGKRVPYDWTLYYLRQKALKEKITLEEFAWILLSYNQKRGYEKTEVNDASTKENEFIEKFDLEVINVSEKKEDERGYFFEIELSGNDHFIYKEYSEFQMTQKGDIKEVTKKSMIKENGDIDESKTEFTVLDIYELEITNVDYKKEEGKHKYTIDFTNGWKEIKQPKNYTLRYKNTVGKEYDYVVETTYDSNGNLKIIKGKERKLREPDFNSDSSNDWTLLKKKTEKEALAFNSKKELKNENGSVKKYISPRIYEVLKNDAKTGKHTKIIGGMFQVVGRDFYREELNDIIATQRRFYSETLGNPELFEQCVKTLYPKNEKHQKNLLKNKKAIQHLLVEDVLLYQRPLKSKKSEIGNCKYEIRYWKNVEEKNTEEKIPVYQKVVSASHPYFQEFRIWDKLHNLKIIQKEWVDTKTGEIVTNKDVTKEYLRTPEDYKTLFGELNNKKSLTQNQFLAFCKKEFKLPYNTKEKNFEWNFPEDEELKGNETQVSFAIRFKRRGFENYKGFLTQEKEKQLWHYLYSVGYKERTANDNKSLKAFFNTFFNNYDITEDIKEKIINDFINFPQFPSKYCAYSEKALKKLLPLIRLYQSNEDSWESEQWYQKWQESLELRKEEIIKRLGKIDFKAETIDYSNAVKTDVDIQKGEIPFQKGLFNVFKNLKSIDEFKGLNLTQASYLVYGRHSELAHAIRWENPKQIRKELHKELKHNSLNNPIAEKVLLEMMQLVADIWEYEKFGNSKPNYFSEIHVEVGRELKKTAKEKERISKNQQDNKKQNDRIRQILEEFLSENEYNANPRNNDHFERLKIVETGAILPKEKKEKKDIENILKKTKISKSDFDKYKLWIEQGYRSPYTGKTIKLTDLFDGDKYNVDHVFPRSLVTNNSLNNKVVCETEINKLKSNQTGRDFILNPKKQEEYCVAHQSKVKVLDDESYVTLVKSQFYGQKREILLSKEIPSKFTSSQLNNARHIARKAMELLSHVVREEGEVEFRSKNVLPVTGAITSELKRAWRLNEVWRDLVQPRFERLNEITQSDLFGRLQKTKNGYEYFDCQLDKTILEKNESFDIKRIDHRHHALDALIIALCTQDHVNYINNINANTKSENFIKQQQIEKHRRTLKKKILYSKPNKEKPKEKDWFFMLPGERRKEDEDNSDRDTVMTKEYCYKDKSFGKEYAYKKMILEALQSTVTSFKQNLRVINKTVNKYEIYNSKEHKKEFVLQEPSKLREPSKNKYNWVIRRSLGQGTFYSKAYVGKRTNKQLLTNSNFFFENIDDIVSNELRTQIKAIKAESPTKEIFKEKLKQHFKKNIRIECKEYIAASRFNSILDKSFDSKKINKISAYESKKRGGIKNILKNHLKQFDTVELAFEEAINYYDALLEKEEIQAIIKDTENEFNTKEDFFDYLRQNSFKYDKTDYKKLNIFINHVRERDFRQEEKFKDKIKEHPEIAFTPEEIEKMNHPENLKRLNNGKKHKPIYKVRTGVGFGKQRAVSENQHSVKSKQYVVNDSGSNLYFGVYEREFIDKNGNIVRERKFKDVGLTDLIEILKEDKDNRFNPLPHQIFDEKQNEYNLIFSLSPLDLVYVPTKEEMKSGKIDFSKIDENRIYKYVDGGDGTANFVPYYVATPIWKFHGKKRDEIYETLKQENKIILDKAADLIQNEFGLGSQQDKNQKSIDGKMIKDICWKLKVDRLGNIELVQ